jgi:hypothetical protein
MVNISWLDEDELAIIEWLGRQDTRNHRSNAKSYLLKDPVRNTLIGRMVQEMPILEDKDGLTVAKAMSKTQALYKVFTATRERILAKGWSLDTETHHFQVKGGSINGEPFVRSALTQFLTRLTRGSGSDEFLQALL